MHRKIHKHLFKLWKAVALFRLLSSRVSTWRQQPLGGNMGRLLASNICSLGPDIGTPMERLSPRQSLFHFILTPLPKAEEMEL
eukprot:2801540-Amphidinium_carterae.1